MSKFISDDRSQSYLLPPDLRDWLPENDMVHFIIGACERVDMSAFKVGAGIEGRPQYHPRMMLGLLVYCYANGIFSSRKIERASYRDIGVRFVAANQQPDHDTIARFRRNNLVAFKAAFVQVLMLAKETGLLAVGNVSIDGTKIDASASKIKTVRYDRAKALRAKLAIDIAALTAKAEAADASDEIDPQALPAEIARREVLGAKLDAAVARLEADAKADYDAQLPEYQSKKAAYDEKAKKRQQRGTAPKPPDDLPPPDAQMNLTDPDSKLMRKSGAHEYRQSYNAQAVVDADGTQLILHTDVITTPSDQPSFARVILEMDTDMGGVGLPVTVLADAGYACGKQVKALQDKGIDPLVAIGRMMPHRPYDFRPPPGDPGGPKDKHYQAIKEPWRIDMKAKLETDDTKALYKKRKQTVEPVFGIIKSVLGFRHFSLRGMDKVKTEWNLIALAYNCKRLAKLSAIA
jgi:transposase